MLNICESMILSALPILQIDVDSLLKELAKSIQLRSSQFNPLRCKKRSSLVSCSYGSGAPRETDKARSVSIRPFLLCQSVPGERTYFTLVVERG